MNLIKKHKKIMIMFLFCILEVCIYSFLFIEKKIINMDLISNFILIPFTIINSLYYGMKSRKKLVLNKLEKLLLTLINLIISFFISGKILFLSSNIINFSIIKIAYYLLLNILTFPVIYNILYSLDKLNLKSNNYRCDKSKKQIVIFFILVFIFFTVVWIGAAYSFFPGNLMTDSSNEYQEAITRKSFTLARPALHTIAISYLLRIWKNPFIIIVSEIVLFSSVLSYIYTYLYAKKVDLKVLIISAIIFSLSANNLKLITFFLTDISFTIGMLLLSFELYRISTEKEDYFKKWYNPLILIIALIITNYSRLNGLVSYAITICYLVYLLFKLETKKTIALVITISLLLNWIIENPLYNHYGVRDSEVSTVGPVSFAVKGLGAITYYNGNLSKKEKKQLEKIITIKEFKEYYSPYNIDTYTWSKLRTKFNDGIVNVGSSTIYKLYINNMFKNPDILIRDRLDGANLLWSYDTPKDGFIEINTYGIEHPCEITGDVKNLNKNCDKIYKQPKNIINKAIEKYQKINKDIKLLFIFNWRPGFILSILLLLIFHGLRKKKRIIPFFLPTIISVLFWAVLMNHPSFRYLWFINVNVFFAVLIILLEQQIVKTRNHNNV